MSDIDESILAEFISESKILVDEFLEKLETIEMMDDENSAKKTAESKSLALADCGNQVDRIMGGAQSLALQFPQYKTLSLIGDISQLCKAVSYRASKVKNNSSLVETAIALLLDVTEILQDTIEVLENSSPDVQNKFSPALVDRLRWFSSQFAQGISGTVESSPKAGGRKETQVMEIEALLKKLGL